ncbi:class I SAM-dependent methyltransferase [Candidatus Pelagibacter sp.]|nr:class I SAM-dependent methyltransferase [Candidatus Pelagibacter sp.]
MPKKLFSYFKSSPRFSVKWDHYFEIYEGIFAKFKNKKITFVEVGVGDGGSLYMWKEFFGKKARIIGVDLNPDTKKLEDDGFEIYIGDQSTKEFWSKLYKKIGKIDILLDDGGHRNLQQITSVVESIKKIRDGGMILIEDTHSSYMKKMGFRNPSKYSFINFCNLLIENIHRRNPMVQKKENIFSDKIHSITFYESITQINILKKIEKSNFVSSRIKNPVFFVDFRNRGYFIKTINLYGRFFGKLKENTFTYKILKKLFHRNIFFWIHEKLKARKYFKTFQK